MSHMFKSFVRNPKGARFYGEDGDERIILLLRRHFITNFKWIIISIFMFFLPVFFHYLGKLNGTSLVSFLPGTHKFILFVFWYLIVSIYIFESSIVWFFNVYIVSNKRVVDMDFSGLLYRRITDAPLRNIEDVTTSIVGVAQVLFNYGNVPIQTAAEIPEIEFESVPDPSHVQDIISDIVSVVKRGGLP